MVAGCRSVMLPGLGGTPQGPSTARVDTTVACCLPDGSCMDTDPLCCDDMGGVPGFADHCLGDIDKDCDTDSVDIAFFQSGFTGPLS